MADVTLPPSTGVQTELRPEDSYRLGFLREVIQEGDGINRADPADQLADQAMSYVLGEQMRTAPERRPTYLPKMVLNETKRAVRRHVSALTDVRPAIGFKTFNPNFQAHATLLNQLTISWWVNTFGDLALGDALKYALVAGTGDLACEFDPNLGPGGDQVLLPRDYRDTLPYRPGRSPSIQSWQGVVLREEYPTIALRARFPDLADRILPDHEGSAWGRGIFSRFRQALRKIHSPADPLAHLQGEVYTGRKTGDGTTLYRFFFKDRSRNISGKPIIMGDPGKGWTYTVNPMEPLYPRGRLIVATETCCLYDGPSPYWHGLFPVTRLRIDTWPWNFLGLGIMHDLMPLQDAINDTGNDFLSTFQQWANRGMIADQKIPEGIFRRLDVRKPGWRVKANQLMGEGVKLVEGPTLPPWSFEFFQFLLQKHAELSGTANLEVLLQMRQMPSDATIQRFYEALTPELRLEGRHVELALRELAEQVKTNFFQFYTTARRVMILGEAGMTLSDFDFDPGNLVPAMHRDQAGYLAELDAQRPRDLRAQYFTGLFTFFVTPNSLLALNAQEEQLKYLALSRQGYLDFWTTMEKLDIPNVGQPPIMPLPPREENIDPTVVLTQPDKYTLDPMSGQVLELRRPETVTERLVAQQLLGIGLSAGPQGANPNAQAVPGQSDNRGRKATGSAPAKLEEKKNEDGTPRQTITTSRKD